MCETPLLHLSQLLEQDSQPNCPEVPQVSGPHQGQDDTIAPLSPESLRPSTLLLESWKSRLSSCAVLVMTAFSFAMSSRVSSSAFSPPSSCSVFSCSLPVQLYSQLCSHSCDCLVSHGLSVTFTQWCFGCSSGKRVSMFVLFCYYPD